MLLKSQDFNSWRTNSEISLMTLAIWAMWPMLAKK
jgi:hypothetical protein